MSIACRKTKFTKMELKALTAKYPDSVTPITNISELEALEQEFDSMCDTHCAEVKGLHANSHMDDYYPIVYDVRSDEVCEECNTAKIPSYNKVTKQQIKACVGCIEALRLVSIKHDPDDEMLCLACHIIYDDYGFIIGVNHSSRDIEDMVASDGETTIKGLKTLVAEGKVHIEPASKIIFIDGEPQVM